MYYLVKQNMKRSILNPCNLLLAVLFLACSFKAGAQNGVYDIGQSNIGPNDTILAYGKIFEGDTLPHWYLQEFAVVENYLDKNRSSQMARLRRNVYLVYPYAVEAARILNELDVELKKADGRRDRKKYLKAVEAQLNEKFKEPLKNLSTTQGSILVKLINRQSGRDVYSIIKELKGGLNARISQTAFYFFDNDLKANYDPFNADKDIEMVVREIESKAYYNYQVQNTPVLKMPDKRR